MADRPPKSELQSQSGGRGSKREVQSPNPEPRTPNPEPRTPNPEPRTPNPEPRTPNPEPRTLPARRAALRRLPRVRRARAARAQDQPHDFIGRRIERLRR
ncbi:hypothetical protein BOC43_06550 [Burkholderia pseudomallei]|nr:hypothetical protein BOC43_06550 [Burkholderia pseudomallei]